jgi:hypothetical protein
MKYTLAVWRGTWLLLCALVLSACGQGNNEAGHNAALAPTITSQPGSQSVVAGGTAQFTVTATGSTPLSYQWTRNGTAIQGAVDASYSITATATDDGAAFAVQVSNSIGSVHSVDAVLTVTAAPGAPTITAQPADQAITAGQTASFSVAAQGTAPLGYQWQKNGSPINGATASSYTTPAAGAADSGSQFSVLVSNGAGQVTSRAAVLTVTGSSAAAPTITTQPVAQSVQAGQSATFTVVANGSTPLSYQWRKNATAISGATGATYTTPATSTVDNGAQYSVVISNSLGSITSSNANLTVTAAGPGTDVVTYKNDQARTGQNVTERLLTTANVNSSSFGKLRTLVTDGKVDGQVLYLSGLSMAGVAHNVVYAGTENDSMYAFDADTGAQLWKMSLIPGTEKVSGPANCDEITPTIGITGTPVIDRAAGVIYVIALTVSSDGATYHHRLHALDISSGAERLGGPIEITATFNSAAGQITFDPQQYVEKAGLLLLNGTLYTAWTSHCDNKFYTGWLMGYNATSLQQSTVLNVAPNSGGVGPAIWMSGGGIAADGGGNIYVITANGAFETTLDSNGFPNMGDFGDSILKISTSGGLKVADYFSPYINSYLQGNDLDLGSGGILLLPDMSDAGGTVRHLAVGAGKDGNIYVVNRDSMGHFTSGSNNIWQQLTGALGNQYMNPSGNGGVWGTPAYFNGTVYYCPRGGLLEAFRFSQARLGSTPSSMSTAAFVYPGCSPAVSANGSSNGIVWALMRTSPAVLYAYDASNLAKVLYSSSQAGGARDQLGTPVTFSAPTIADGKVFIQQANGIAVFGLLN